MSSDTERLERLTGVLRDALADLDRYAATVERRAVLHDRDTQHMVLHAMYLATQSSIDAGAHILASRGLARAASYADVFRRLGEAGVIDDELAESMAAWASMRNVLAHFYPILDLGRVHDALLQDLGVLRDFLGAVEALAGTAGTGS